MTLLISISALCLAGRANAQGAPTAESSVTPNISQESVKGAGVVFRAAEKMQGATGRMNAAMLKRRDACMALARAGKLGDPKGNGAMAQYKCIVAGSSAERGN